MHQSVDVAIEANKDTEVSDRLDVTFEVITLIVKYRKLFPWVALTLLDTEADSSTFFVNIQHHDFNFITDLNNL